MITNVIEDIKYRNLMEEQIRDIIDYLIVHNEEFSVTANIKGLTFNPPIPQPIFDNFSKFTMFSLQNYTYSTLEVGEDSLSFEAGFGEENFGSIVSVPLLSIMQIIVDETPLFVNLAVYKEEEVVTKELDGKGVKNSMASFLSNPENSKFLK